VRVHPVDGDSATLCVPSKTRTFVYLVGRDADFTTVLRRQVTADETEYQSVDVLTFPSDQYVLDTALSDQEMTDPVPCF
jgi:hypothetical protein